MPFVDDLREKLLDIRHLVKSNFTYKTDEAQYQKRELWVEQPDDYDGTTPVVGDCEDFALACRKLCKDSDIPTRLVVCLDETGEAHCVLEAKGYIIDNRVQVSTKRSMERLGYKWLAISGYKSGDPWMALDN